MNDAVAWTILQSRYLRQGENFMDMLYRVANHVAAVEAVYGNSSETMAEDFLTIMARRDFLPSSPILFNAGSPDGQLAACFVLPIDDSMESILGTLQQALTIQKSGGGTGFSFSRIRCQGDKIRTTGGSACGPVSFIRLYDAAMKLLHTGAVRPAANMGVLRVDHPDVESFVMLAGETLATFNLAVGVTDAFMEAVGEDEEFSLRDPKTGEPLGSVNARELFRNIAEQTWQWGDPGLIFLDRINEKNPTPVLGSIEGTNPCGEQPLLPNEACVLGSVNLANMVEGSFGRRQINFERLGLAVRTGIRFLDDVLEVSGFPSLVIREAALGTRKVGLGIMGLADMLIRLGLPYASQSGVDLTEKVVAFITEEARQMSRELARERGSFPAFSDSVHALGGEKLMRNATVTTLAPTGTISLIAGCSSGVEPLFALSVSHHALQGKWLHYESPYVKEYLQDSGEWSEKVAEDIQENGSVKDSSVLSDTSKNILAIACDIAPEWHLAHVAVAQAHIDNGVAKTINLPYEASREMVEKIFLEAYAKGCKGITVYRNGSRKDQTLYQGWKNECKGCE